MKKRVLLIICLTLIILCGCYFSIHFYTTTKINDVKEKVLEHNPAITKVVEIASIGAWGEWFSEYTAIVEMNGGKYRIWTSPNGQITEMEEMR